MHLHPRTAGLYQIAKDPEKYLLLSNSHDGNSAVQIKFTPIRVVCENTLTMALSQGPTLRIPHTKDVQERVRLAANLLNAIKIRYSEVGGVFKRMARTQIKRESLEQYFRQVFPEPRRRSDDTSYQRALTQVLTDRAGSEYMFEMGRGNNIKGTAGTLWAAYNGVTEYIDHRKYAKAADDRHGANHVDDTFRLGEHRHVAAVELIGRCPHALSHGALQIGVHCVVFFADDIPAWLRLPSGSPDFRLEQIGFGGALSCPNELLDATNSDDWKFSPPPPQG